MAKGRYGIHGGQFVPEVLMNAVHELEREGEGYGRGYGGVRSYGGSKPPP